MRTAVSPRRVAAIVVAHTLMIGFAAQSTIAGVTLLSSPDEWMEQAGIVRAFSASAKNIALADGIGNPPTDGASLGMQSLVFAPAETTFSFTFTLTSLHYDWVYNAIAQSYAESHISPGTTEGQPNDDWKIEFGEGRPVYSFAFDLLDNAENGGETLTVYDTAGTLLASFDTPAVAGTASTHFLGIISTVPIGRIEYEEDAGGDDIAIGGFRFGTVETCAADLNFDGAVDGADLAVLLGSWGLCF